jgi:hypothetical protein
MKVLYTFKELAPISIELAWRSLESPAATGWVLSWLLSRSVATTSVTDHAGRARCLAI